MNIFNEKLIIDLVNTDRGVKLIENWIKSNGIVDIKVERIPAFIVIRGRAYSSRDGINYVADDGAWSDLVVISKDRINVSPIYKWKRRKSLDNWAVDYNKSWRDDSIGGMLSNMNNNSLNIGIGNMRPYNHKSNNEYMRESDRLRSMFREKQVYIKDGNDLQDDLCQYIMNIPSIIRDEKINQILS